MVTITCTKCAHQNDPSAGRCARCGKEFSRLFASSAGSAPSVTPQAPPAPPPAFHLRKAHAAALVFAVICIAGFWTLLYNFGFGLDLTTRMKLEAAASATNAQCPVMIDDQTRLDRAEVTANAELTYFYTLTEVDASQIDTVAFKNAMEPPMVEFLRTSKDMQPLLETGASLLYRYSDRRGSYVATVVMSADKYRPE